MLRMLHIIQVEEIGIIILHKESVQQKHLANIAQSELMAHAEHPARSYCSMLKMMNMLHMLSKVHIFPMLNFCAF